MGRIVGLVVEPPKKFVCPHCGKEFKTENALDKHIEKEHSDEE